MDRDIRRARRRAVHGDVNAATRALAGQLRAGRLSADALELPAALGYEPALRLLTPDRIAFVGSLRRRSPAATRAGRKLISKTAHFGYEAVLRGGVALVHAVRERFPAEAQRDPAGLTAPWLTGCLDAVEDAVCYGEGELRDRAVELDTLANNAYLDDSLSALVANLEAAGCWATLSLLALVGTAQRGGYFRVGKIGDLARDSVEHYAFKALREQLRLSKPKVEAEALAILRRELVSWALGEGDPSGVGTRSRPRGGGRVRQLRRGV